MPTLRQTTRTTAGTRRGREKGTRNAGIWQHLHCRPWRFLFALREPVFFLPSSFRLSVSSQATRTIIQTDYFLQPKMSMRPERQPANGNCPTNGLSRSSPAHQLTTGSSSLGSRISSTQASHLTNSMHLIANQRACRTNVVWVECGGETLPATNITPGRPTCIRGTGEERRQS